jgi:hypothetical protein
MITNAFNLNKKHYSRGWEANLNAYFLLYNFQHHDGSESWDHKVGNPESQHTFLRFRRRDSGTHSGAATALEFQVEEF